MRHSAHVFNPAVHSLLKGYQGCKCTVLCAGDRGAADRAAGQGHGCALVSCQRPRAYHQQAAQGRLGTSLHAQVQVNLVSLLGLATPHAPHVTPAPCHLHMHMHMPTIRSAGGPAILLVSDPGHSL